MGSGDGCINAVAGAGKSTTLVEAARMIATGGVFVAFNSHIAAALRPKLANTHMAARTIHSVGYEVLQKEIGKPEVRDGKYWRLTNQYAGERPDLFNKPGIYNDLKRLLQLVRLTLTPLRNDQALSDMAEHYGVRWRERYGRILRLLIDRGDKLALDKEKREIDFTDMIWLPNRLKLQPRRYPWVFIDECQDLSAAARALVLKLRAPRGRQLYVGDPRQSIMMFAGADDQSFNHILEATRAKELPLSICYRCPSSHVQMAQKEVPQIQAATNAPVGIIHWADDQSVESEIQLGDMIICRRNAPLIRYCLMLIRRQIHARIQGEDLGKELGKVCRMIGRQAGNFSGFMHSLLSWKSKERDRLEAGEYGEWAFEELDDQFEALTACYEAFPHVKDAIELSKCLEDLFSDDKAAVTLSSIHRAKGLECRRVWILEFQKLGQPRKKQRPHEAKQERNLWYVAVTRSMEILRLHRTDVVIERSVAA